MESLNHQVVAVLMHLDIKHLTIPHLKALNCSIEQTKGQGCGSSFKQCIIVLKRSILLPKKAKQQFHVMVAA